MTEIVIVFDKYDNCVLWTLMLVIRGALVFQEALRGMDFRCASKVRLKSFSKQREEIVQDPIP